MAQNSGDQLINALGDQYKKLPNLPKSWTDVIVIITPWFALIFGVLGILASIAAFGILTFLAPIVILGSGVGIASGGIIGSLLALVSSGLLVFAFPGTNARKIPGWNLLFWAMVVSVVSSIVAFSLAGIVGGLIGFYILFQIKSYYK